jgi:hypothetical protein
VRTEPLPSPPLKTVVDPPNSAVAFLCGAVSALMPTVVNLFNQSSHGQALAIANWYVFLPVALLYALFAGAFTSW